MKQLIDIINEKLVLSKHNKKDVDDIIYECIKLLKNRGVFKKNYTYRSNSFLHNPNNIIITSTISYISIHEFLGPLENFCEKYKLELINDEHRGILKVVFDADNYIMFDYDAREDIFELSAKHPNIADIIIDICNN